MDKSNQTHSCSWRNQPIVNKVHLIISVICLVVSLIFIYFIKMSGDPAEVGNASMTVAIFIICIDNFSSLIVQATNAHRYEEMHEASLEMVRAETARKEAETNLILEKAHQILTERAKPNSSDAEQAPAPMSEEEIRRLIIAVNAERDKYDPDQTSDDVISKRYARPLSKIIKSSGTRVMGVYSNPNFGQSNDVKSLDESEQSIVVVQLTTDDLQAKETKKVVQKDLYDQLATQDTEENTSQPDSPENQILEDVVVASSSDKEIASTTEPEPKSEFPSIEEQAKELGMAHALLKFYLGNLQHYSQLTYSDYSKLRKQILISGNIDALARLDQSQQLGNQVYDSAMVS